MYDHVVNEGSLYTENRLVSHFPSAKVSHVSALPGSHVPNSNFTVTTTANQNVIPWNHRPYPHHVALQGSMVVPVGVVHMNLSVIHGEDNVFWRQV